MLVKQKILFNDSECVLIKNLIKNNIQNWELMDRKYNSQQINYTKQTEWIFEKLKEFVETVTDIKIKKIKKTIHFHKFIKGDWFDKHNDLREGRIYAIGVLLNNNFDGGDFKLYGSNEIILNKIIGNTYIFDVSIEHEITRIVDGERYSLLWFLEKEHIKFETNKLL